MKYSHLSVQQGPGTQPVRVLQPRILGLFKNVQHDFLTLLQQSVDAGADPGVTYFYGPDPAETPGVTGERGKVAVQETFLSYLWAVSYSLLVLFDEGVQRPRGAGGGVVVNASQSRALRTQADTLLAYGLTLQTMFRPWPVETLPNPEFYTEAQVNPEAEAYYVEKANTAFYQAAVFVMLHEFAYYHLQHLATLMAAKASGQLVTLADRQRFEVEADQYAIATMLAGAGTTTNRASVATGIVLGLCAILLRRRSLRATGPHPSPHDRLRAGLTQLNLEPEEDILWGLGAMSLALWALKRSKPLLQGAEHNTNQEWFEQLFAQLQAPEYWQE